MTTAQILHTEINNDSPYTIVTYLTNGHFCAQQKISIMHVGNLHDQTDVYSLSYLADKSHSYISGKYLTAFFKNNPHIYDALHNK